MSEVDDRDGDVVDIEAARERRRMGDLPPALREGVVVRRGFGLAETFCTHRQADVDTQARIVRCRACGVDLDAMDVLGMVASEWESLARAIKERQRLNDEIERLRRAEKRAKGRVRTAEKRAATLPPVDGEIAALRTIAHHYRRYATHGAGPALFAALDATTEPAEKEHGEWRRCRSCE